MIISRGRGYCFVHSPKTGGTSMALALEDRAMADDILIGDTPKALRRKGRLKGVQTRGRLWKHSTVADAEGLLTPEDLDRLVFFTLVRNPWDRMVSYYHWLQDQSFDHVAVGLSKSLGFEDFVLHPTIAATFEQAPAEHYLTDSAGIERAGHYVRVESFPADFSPLAEHLGFDVTLGQANASHRDRDYRRYFSDVSADRIALICAKDIERFDYTFG